MNRLSRWCALVLLALGACFLTALPARAATATATLQQGPLSISPTYVTLTYHAAGRGTERTIASSFSVNVVDARGTKAGWDISAATVSTTGPSGYFPTDAHVITDFNISYANGTPPDPTGPCDVIPTMPGMILHNRPETGMGQSTESFSTQLALPADARGGTYSATLMLTIAPIGSVNAMPGARPPSAPTSPGSQSPPPAANPNSSPSSRTSPGSASAPGTPNVLPVARPNGGFPLPPAPDSSTSAGSTTGTQRVAVTNDDSPAARPATTTNTLDAAATNAKTAAPTTAPTSTQTGTQPRTTSVTTSTNDSGPSANAAVTNSNSPTASAASPAAPASASAAGGNTATTTEPQRVVSSDPLPGSAPSNATMPATVLAYPVIAVGDEAMTLTLPFVPSLYDPIGGGPAWHLQTTFDLPTASGRHLSATMPIRTNAGRLFNTVVNPDTNQATVTFNPLLATQNDTSLTTGSAVLVITIVAGP